MADFTTRRLSPHIGIEAIGLDPEQEIDAATQERLQAAWIEGGILLVRGVHSNEAHQRLSQCFGTLEISAVKEINNADNPYLMELRYHPDDPKSADLPLYEVDGVIRASWLGWHWDQAFMPTIVRGAVLRMVEPATVDGQTGFIDAIAAYERLPQRLKDRIDGLEVVYQFCGDQEQNLFGYPKTLKLARARANVGEVGERRKKAFPPVVHPLVITQRESGRKVLKLSPMHSKYIRGMDPADSDALLEELANHLVDPRFAYFHEWQPDDLIAWDNWRVIHSARGVPPATSRFALRTTLLGDYGYGRYLDPASAPADTARIVD